MKITSIFRPQKSLRLFAILALNISLFSLWTIKEGTWNKTIGQKTEVSRHESVDDSLLLPNDDVINGLTADESLLMYWRYINNIQYLCKVQRRLGSLKDGGKELCLEENYRPRNDCLVYSFGSNYQFDFEIDVHRQFRCQIHTFDPSMTKVDKRAAIFTTFHSYGLGASDSYNKRNKWHLKRLTTIMKELGHSERYIDILKIDIEGGEWFSLQDIVKSGVLYRVRQLCIEFHFGKYNRVHWPKGNGTFNEQLKVLKMLYASGFRIFMRDHNLVKIVELFDTKVAPINEVSMVNIFLKYNNSDLDYNNNNNNNNLFESKLDLTS